MAAAATSRRQEGRFVEGAVVVGLEVDGAFAEFAEQQFGDRRQARFGIAHGGGTVAVARTEIALAVDQRIAQRKGLGDAHHGVVG
jgi:hypothetical protein